MLYIPIGLIFFLAFWFLFALLVGLIQIGILQYVFESMGISRRYLLAVENPAESDEEVVYRGLTGMLWKRDYGAHYQSSTPGIQVVSTGELGPTWDDARFWLLAKSEKRALKSG